MPVRHLSTSVEGDGLRHHSSSIAALNIASQGKLTAPLQMRTYDQTDGYVFTKDDPQRSHIMPIGISARGSVVWQAIDVRADAVRWIERRSLSDRMITPAVAASRD
jgi:hypothetical protein